ncbi:MAG: Diphthine synthase [Candidatus Heimdallarchaeota archaeon LC_3]|nr:MAG: Diphthine synthase [Candidatus Heimdallarchaeota archaeon LC_3]
MRGKFFLIGYGLSGPDGLTLHALNVLKSVDIIFFEIYTNFPFEDSLKDLENVLQKKIIPISRTRVEDESTEFLKAIKNNNVALLISGDPFIATTHHSLWLEASNLEIDVEVINNISIYNLVPSLTGLSAYKFGKISSITFPDNFSVAPYDTLQKNLDINAHTLFLLDIEINSNKFLEINKALDLLLKMEQRQSNKLITEDTLLIGLAHIGTNKSKIVFDSLKNQQKIDWKSIGPPQAIVIPGNLHFAEEEILNKFWGKEGSNPVYYKKSAEKIVVTGSFDIIHPGHIQFFHEAKKQNPNAELIVVIARDSSIREFKDRDPILPEDHRLQVLRSLQIVDKAVLGNEGKDKIKIIEEIDPDLIVLGYDQWISEEKLISELNKRELKTKVVRLKKYGNSLASSTEIRKKIGREFSNKTNNQKKTQ